MKKNRELSIYSAIPLSLFLVFIYATNWMGFYSDMGKYDSIDITTIIGFVFCSVLVLIVGKRMLVYVWYRKEFKKARWYWIWGGIINTFYIAIANPLALFFLWILEIGQY